ncbi:MAG: hypothetical protein JWN84_3903 [Nocardioides sp.]|nr:hypothetical protein [Nocardioides sp.]
MRTPVVLLTGVDPDALATTMVSLQFDLPTAVAVRHHIDVERAVLQRTVSDVTGVLEREEIDLEHACVGCAVREDVLPTLDRLAAEGRWASIVAHLPVGAAAQQVCAAVEGDTRLSRRLRIAAVVAAVAGPTLVEDLVGDDLLVERGLQTSEEDVRGVGEVACALVEGADALAVHGHVEASGLSLLVDLARPDALLAATTAQLDGARLLAGLHDHARTRAWTDPARTHHLPPVPPCSWRVDLRSDRAFHPARLLESLGRLGGGRHRSRGCFWLPTRPDDVLAWDGAGGQLSVGRSRPWGRQARHTRIVLHGVGHPPAHLQDAFDDLLLRPDEAAAEAWSRTTDGFEAWLGPVRRAA